MAADKLKYATSKDQDDKLREIEDVLGERMVQVFSEAVEGLVVQVKDEMIPESKLWMYDAITKESNQLKLEL